MQIELKAQKKTRFQKKDERPLGQRSPFEAQEERPPQACRMTPDGKFRKHEHILKSKDYRAVYKKGLSVKQGPLILSYLPNGLAHSRIGFSISSRNVRLASRRNRTRRLFREAYRKNKNSIKRGFDIVFIVKRSFPENMMYSGAEEALSKIAGAAKLLI